MDTSAVELYKHEKGGNNILTANVMVYFSLPS
jgi:hypothetical protein